MDFYKLKVKTIKSNNREADFVVYPDFVFANVKDLICKGGSMYAFWTGTEWSTRKDDLILTIDKAIAKKISDLSGEHPGKIITGRFMNDNETKLMQSFEQYCKLMTQSQVTFNTRIIFANEVLKREDYATTQMPYSPVEGSTEAFDELVGLLYTYEELEKILWFIGALLTNNMSKIQKFMYLFGGKGSGKGTVIKLFKMLFPNYYSGIDLMTLTSGSEFATSQIKEVPLLIDEDSDISRITKDVNLLKLTAHEPISVNVKYKDTYETIFNGLLITASNQRFQVRNIDSGITRRAVVVTPTSYTHSSQTYFRLMDQIKFEIPHIADRAMKLFEEKGPFYYEDYMDVAMAEATDYIFSFVREYSTNLGDVISLKRASELFKLYLEDLGYETKGYKRRIKTELQRYYRNFYDKYEIDGERVRNVFVGFRHELVFPDKEYIPEPEVIEEVISLGEYPDIFMEYAKTYPAQLATSSGTPSCAWDECTTKLESIDQSELHFVRVPLNHIVIDFDLKNLDGEKDRSINLEAASKFPPTYTELSKSGQGVHLHYTYDGDVSKLASLYDDDIEIKVFNGKSSLRRKYTKSNNKKIAHITTGLPYKEKEGVTVYDSIEEIIWNEKKLRKGIQGNLDKKYHDATKPSIDFIDHMLKEADASGIKFDLSDMKQSVIAFAMSSSNNASYCLGIVNKMIFCNITEDNNDIQDIQKLSGDLSTEDLYMYDIEVFPNLFIVAYKKYGVDNTKYLINPTPQEVESILRLPLVGYNNRRYDNHIMYAAMMGKSNIELFHQSQGIINSKGTDGQKFMYSGAYELSYADIYEYITDKKSLKKWEIELGIKHDEMELPWDQPVPEELWDRVGEYCMNDVTATEAVFDHTISDYNALMILSELSGLSPNATITQQAAAFLFGDDKRPQDKFVYTDLSEMFEEYEYSYGKSSYKGEDPGEGGYVYSEPGVYKNVALLDVESMHPTSLIEMNYFGPYTQKYADLKQTRLYIKHRDYESARKMFGGILSPYLEDETKAKELSYALKIIINIVYGMTSAKFDNKFKHKDNIDNIVAKRGALFMIDLKNEVKKAGYTVAHIKTDSIKIPDADDFIIKFVHEFGKNYGYKFEHEATYSKLALVNKSVYICKDDEGWHATGAQFAEPYVYKTLFTKEELEEKDFFTTKSVKSAIYLDDMFVGKVASVYASKTGRNMTRVQVKKVADGDDEVVRAAVTGTKGFLWELSSDFKGHQDIDMAYYRGLVQNAIDAIDAVGPSLEILEEVPVGTINCPF